MASPDDIRAGGASIEFRADLARLQKDLSEGGPMMQTLKRAFGKGSTVGQFTQLIKGAGAIGGLSATTYVLDSVLRKAVELKDAFNSGKASAGDIAVELAKSVPILGQLISAGQALDELFTGRAAAEARAYREAVEELRAAVEGRAGVRDLRTLMEKSAEERDRFGQRTADLRDANTPGMSERDRELARLDREFNARIRDLDKQLGEILKKIPAHLAGTAFSAFAREWEEWNKEFARREAELRKSWEREDFERETDATIDAMNKAVEAQLEEEARRKEQEGRAGFENLKAQSERIELLNQQAETPEQRVEREVGELGRLLADGLISAEVFQANARRSVNQADLSTSPEMTSTGTFNPFAAQSLRNDFSIQREISPELKRLRQIVEQIFVRSISGQSAIVFE